MIHDRAAMRKLDIEDSNTTPSATDALSDRRKVPIFIHSVIDDMTDITPYAMRVYMHLARRANNQTGIAFPSYQSIGDHCFSCISQKKATRKTYARKAIDELILAGLISKTERATSDGGQTSNEYRLVEPDAPCLYKHGGAFISTGGAYISTGGAYKGTEDTPLEDNSIEDSPKKNPPPPPIADPQTDSQQNGGGGGGDFSFPELPDWLVLAYAKACPVETQKRGWQDKASRGLAKLTTYPRHIVEKALDELGDRDDINAPLRWLQVACKNMHDATPPNVLDIDWPNLDGASSAYMSDVDELRQNSTPEFAHLWHDGDTVEYQIGIECRPRTPQEAPDGAEGEKGYSDTWNDVLSELGRSGQFDGDVLERASIHQDAATWRVELDRRDAHRLEWMQRQGATLIRKTLNCLLGQAVTVEIVAPDAVSVAMAV